MSTAKKLEQAVTQWLLNEISAKGAEILDGQVTAETYERRKAYRQALKDVLGTLPKIAKKVEDD